MANLFDGPPTLQGNEQSQLIQVYRYLQMMSDQLNMAMNNMTLDNFAEGTQKQIKTVIEGGGATKEIANATNTVRSMIIKSAEIVHNEMEEISAELKEQYMAVSSQFGELDRKLSSQITANAEGINQNYEYIETLISRADGMDDYVERRNEYIFTGLIGYREENGIQIPVYGIAIGENVTQYDEDGNPYLNDNAKVATFTKERLSFWQGTTEMAYFSNKRMYITECEILTNMKMGRFVWRIQANGSMGLMRVSS